MFVYVEIGDWRLDISRSFWDVDRLRLGREIDGYAMLIVVWVCVCVSIRIHVVTEVSIDGGKPPNPHSSLRSKGSGMIEFNTLGEEGEVGGGGGIKTDGYLFMIMVYGLWIMIARVSLMSISISISISISME